ncbi:metallo-beta-lactamase family protein [Phenylobacterium zucineum HLK1]|uniref:Metallo-beta-lactamase family protein n=2 Tax=Pseudomonadota TaxID=1224 RepID=B4R877_PHEZH|nr:N-acyl homoserine lactonase family protein [Phenylobacterium zucineum]ACG79195.1 metallo-beta-lactamase family protein [Phenylobacterium zucineum HLK1]
MIRRAALALAILLAVPRLAQAAPPDVRLYTLDCGRLVDQDLDPYADDGAYKGLKRTMVVPCYLVRHPKGDLLWDTGVPQAIADMPGGKAPGGVEVKRKLTDQLAELGLSPADIEYLALSHSHFDHIGNAGLFAGATWIVDPDERAWAFRPQARANKTQFAAYSALETAKTAEVGEQPHDVFGDGSALIAPAPGHTPGHTVLLVRLAKAGPVLLTGDLWHAAESRAGKRVPRFNVDRAETLASYEAVEALAAREKARVVRQHVPEDFEAMPRFPEPLR